MKTLGNPLRILATARRWLTSLKSNWRSWRWKRLNRQRTYPRSSWKRKRPWYIRLQALHAHLQVLGMLFINLCRVIFYLYLSINCLQKRRLYIFWRNTGYKMYKVIKNIVVGDLSFNSKTKSSYEHIGFLVNATQVASFKYDRNNNCDINRVTSNTGNIWLFWWSGKYWKQYWNFTSSLPNFVWKIQEL